MIRVMMVASLTAALAGCLPEGEGLEPRPGAAGGPNDTDVPGGTQVGDPVEVDGPPAVAGIRYRFKPDYPSLPGNVSYAALNLPAWASVDADTGAITGTPGNEDVAAQVLLAVVASGAARDVPVRVTIEVMPEAALRSRHALSFYATDFAGKPRVLRNDLTAGTLQGEVQFVQSHASAPADNYVENRKDQTQSRYMPKMVALRETLLLFIPKKGQDPTTVSVRVSAPGQAVATRHMAPPGALPASDFTGARRVEYSNRAWSLVLPWDVIRNGLSLRFVADQGSDRQQYGILPAERIDVGRATQLVIQSIRLGMLTAPSRGSDHYTLRDPIMAATDYFQTLPISRLVMGSYADVHLRRVILADGTIYCEAVKGEPAWDARCDNTDGRSRVDGGPYSGDMRENVAKSQVSVGINMADYGYPTNNMAQYYPLVYKQITLHHAWGLYQNGRQGHGLSGGNGIATLYASRGNEASHEWGHNWLGHYPGQSLTKDGRWAKDNPDTGWGYIAFRNRMRSTIDGLVAVDDGCQPFQPGGLYCFIPSPMSGGYSNSPFSVYSRYTGYDARIIQNRLAQHPIPVAASSKFPSGYKIWNTTSGQYEAHDEGHPVPVQVGVPVATILGGYDPDSAPCATEPANCEALIYPVFHGNYGNLFELPEPEPTGDQCWVQVGNAEGEILSVAVPVTRNDSGTINQINFNVAADFRPTSARLYCRRAGQEVLLTARTFDPTIPELPPVAIVGQAQGYSQLREREMAEIDQALTTTDVRVLTGDLAVKVDSYTDRELQSGLSGTAWERLAALRQSRRAAASIDALLNYTRKLGLSGEEQAERLLDKLQAVDFIDTLKDLKIRGDVIKVPGIWSSPYHFLDAHLDQGRYVTMAQPQDPANASRWVIDLQGRIHPVSRPWQCLVPSGGRVALVGCRNGIPGQRWIDTRNAQGHHQLRNVGNHRCLNYDRARYWPITWPCSGSWNEQWRNVTHTDSPVLSLMEGELIREVYGLLLPAWRGAGG